MPLLERPDGVTLHWEEAGDGPAILIAGLSYGYPEMVQGLVGDLAADHRVLVPDLRGTGGSSRPGPYDMATDVADLGALLERVGGAEVAVGLGDGALRAVELAAARADLLDAVVISGYPSFFRGEGRGTEALSASAPVLVALVKLLDRLWILHHDRNPWFPAELAARIPQLLPYAHLEEVADGAISRPDLTAAAVRRITRAGV